MPMPDEISLGEVARRLDRFERSVDQQFTGVHRQIESMQYVSRETYEARHKALSARVEELEDSKRWFSRGLVVSFVFPVLVAIVLALVLTK